MFSVRTKGQSTLEYVILIGFVVAALIAMGIYMKRGVQGKLRESADQVGEQYSAEHTLGKYQIETDMSQTETMTGDGASITKIDKNIQTKTGLIKDGAGAYETIEGIDSEKLVE